MTSLIKLFWISVRFFVNVLVWIASLSWAILNPVTNLAASSEGQKSSSVMLTPSIETTTVKTDL